MEATKIGRIVPPTEMSTVVQSAEVIASVLKTSS